MARTALSVVLLMSILLISSSILGCTTKEDGEDKIGLIVTIGPQKEMVVAVGGDLVVVTVMVPPGESPHTYAPVPSQMKQVARAKAYLKVGSGIELELNHLDELKAQNRDMKVFDLSKGVTLREMEDHDHEEDDHEGMDPHIWLSLLNVKVMVGNIYEALVELDHGNQGIYETNRDAYLGRLDAVHNELEDRFDDQEGDKFLIYHPSWGYFAHEYGLEQIAVEEGGKEPGPAGIADVVRQAEEQGIEVIYVDPSFDQTKAEAIASELGGRVVTLDPLAEDYIDNMRRSGSKLEEGLTPG